MSPLPLPTASVKPDKRRTAAEVVGELADGMTIGFGGWGARRKPMGLVKEILRSDLRDLTIVGFGGPEFGMLCAAGKVRRAVFGFVSLDSVALDPYFRQAREAGTIDAVELDEGMLQWALRAAAMRVSFLPCRAGLGSDLLAVQPDLRTVECPYGSGESYVAVPALRLDAAIVHANRADRHGNAQYLGADWYFDDLFCMAAERRYVSCERIVDTETFLDDACVHTLRLNRAMVDAVVAAPNGAGFTSCPPDYGRDDAGIQAYVRSAHEPGAWKRFAEIYLGTSEGNGQSA